MRIPLSEVKSESKKIKNEKKELLTSMTPSSPATTLIDELDRVCFSLLFCIDFMQ